MASWIGGAAAGRWLLAGSALVAAAAVVTSAGSPGRAQPAPERQTVWLDQNWDDEDRATFHHADQGTATLPIPYTWFMALEQPDSQGLLSDPAYLDRFGFIPGRSGPGGLPIGFARSQGVDFKTGEATDQIGFTCAACHTARIDFGSTTMLIDGGPALTNLGDFRNALGKALLKAAKPGANFDRFAKRIYPGSQFGDPRRWALWQQLTGGLIRGLIAKLEVDGRGKGTIDEGFGRLDALNRIGNEVFANQMEIDDNIRALTAPVAYPHIWDTSWFDWVQYNSSIEQPMVRNAGEAMGVAAKVNWKRNRFPLFASTVPVDRLYAIETSLAGRRQPQEDDKFTGLRSPRWPERILGRIDEDLARRGKALYHDPQVKCSVCHLPGTDTDEFWDDRYWTRADVNPGRERYLALRVIPISVVGTDDAQAADMKARTVRLPAALGFPDPLRSAGRDRIYAFGPALGAAVERVVNQWYDSRTPPTPAADRLRMNGFRPNGIRDPLAYKARPLNGIWATAPFLHNGSVPTLYALLSPYRERPKTFWLGNRQFDRLNVGYVATEFPGGFKLDTGIRGNRNTGHLFDVPDSENKGVGIIGRPLTPDERRALIEYLKTL